MRTIRITINNENRISKRIRAETFQKQEEEEEERRKKKDGRRKQSD